MTDSLFIRVNDKLVQIPLADIYYVEALKNYSLVCTKTETYKILVRMRQVEEELPEPSFCRIHRSYIVALEHIDFIRDNSVIISENTIPIGAQYRAGFWKRLLILNRNKLPFPEIKESFFIRSDKQLVKIRVADILFVEGQKNYVFIKTKTETHQALLTMKQMEKALPKNVFCRVHHSFIVAIRYLSSVTFESVVLLKHTIPIGGIYKNKFFERIDILQQGNDTSVPYVQKSSSHFKNNV